MPSRKIHSTLNSIINKLRAFDELRHNALLYPLNHCRKNIVLRIERNTRLRRIPTLTQHPRPWPGTAMKHARDTEKTRPFIHICVRVVTAEMLVESVRVERRNLVILLAVVHEQLPAILLEAG